MNDDQYLAMLKTERRFKFIQWGLLVIAALSACIGSLIIAGTGGFSFFTPFMPYAIFGISDGKYPLIFLLLLIDIVVLLPFIGLGFYLSKKSAHYKTNYMQASHKLNWAIALMFNRAFSIWLMLFVFENFLPVPG